MSPAGSSEPRRGEDGFALFEMLIAISIFLAVAALCMPLVLPQRTSRTKLRAVAYEVAAVLKGDRLTAMLTSSLVATAIDPPNRVIRSPGGRVVALPDDVEIRAILPSRCAGLDASTSIQFLPNGSSCGGNLRLSKADFAYEIETTWINGGVHVSQAAP